MKKLDIETAQSWVSEYIREIGYKEYSAEWYALRESLGYLLQRTWKEAYASGHNDAESEVSLYE